MDLHPYDGVERRFRDGDGTEPEVLLPIVERLLGVSLPRPTQALRYDLSFYSGGIGVLDRLKLTLPASDELFDSVVRALGLVPARELFASDDFRWLVDAEEGDVEPELLAFVDAQRAEFQPDLASVDEAFFDPDSNVNAWKLVYRAGGTLHFIAFDQG